jgi:predicted AAA+ superfamily ATPase
MTFHYQRPIAATLEERLAERPRRIQIVTGPRQVGKTTLVNRLLAQRPAGSGAYFAADQPSGPTTLGATFRPAGSTARVAAARADTAWLVETWREATQASLSWAMARNAKNGTRTPHPYFALVIDEIQKVPGWSETIKGLWDASVTARAPLHLVLLGSSPLLMQRGLTESLAGRHEIIPMRHWTFTEMSDAFGLDLDHYIFFGAYPGAAEYVDREDRWRDYVRDGLIQPNIERDILQMTRVDKPALLKQLFELGCAYSGQIVALDKIVGTLREAGNTVTLTRYLSLLESAGLLAGLHKYSDHEIRRRNSPPKFQVLNTALMSALSTYTFAEARADRSYWGRVVESAVGAHLCNSAETGTRIHYWRESPLEVDFVIGSRKRLAAVEVKSGKSSASKPGLDEFCRRHRGCRRWVVGDMDLPIGEFLRYPADHWVE